jgi:hypothetical protein
VNANNKGQHNKGNEEWGENGLIQNLVNFAHDEKRLA